MNLHDWIDEVCDTLELETEVDEALLLDLTKIVADNVERLAAPVTAYLLGYAAGVDEAGPDGLEHLAGRVQSLAESWDRPHAVPQQRDEETDSYDIGETDLSGDVPDDVARELDEDREEAEVD